MSGTNEAWQEGARLLADAGIDSARLDARVLLAHAMNIETGALPFAGEPSADELHVFKMLIARRLAREPVAYITGEKEFWSLSFAIGPGALIPRPETETLLQEALAAFPDRLAPLDVLDLGTGSGCLLIAFLVEFANAKGTGLDRSAEALAWAQRNAERSGVAARSRWHQADWSKRSPDARYDVIFSNPPYLARAEGAGLAPEIARYEPGEALYAGEDGLDAYRALAPFIARALQPAGRAFLEIGAGQEARVSEILGRLGLEVERVAPDLSGVPRCVVTRRRAR